MVPGARTGARARGLCIHRPLLSSMPVTVRRLAGSAAALALLVSAAAARTAEGVPVWIANPEAAAAVELPVRLGIPWPPGRLADAAPLRLRLADGEPRAVQALPLERWPDGSVRWLLADVVLPAAAAGRTVATLEPGEPSRPPTIHAAAGPPVTIRSQHLAIEVGPTGTLTVRLLGTPAPDVVIDPVGVDTGRDGPSPVTAIRVVSPGPVRAEVLIERTHPGGVVARTSVVAWAGSTTLLLQHRLVNEAMVPSAPLRSVPVTIHVPHVTRAAALVDGAAHTVEPGTTPVRLLQTDPSQATSGGTALGTHLDGGVAVGTAEMALTAVVPDFWQQYPKAIAISADAVTIDLVAGGARPVALGVGAAKSHDVWLRLERPAQATALATLAHVLGDPPRALAAPAWTRATGALPEVIAPEAPAARALLAHLRSDALRYDARARYERWDAGPPGPCSARATADVHVGFYGVLNWGDWNFPGYRDEAKECDAWGNLEYDLPFVFGLAWASTGDPLWARWFDRALAHYRDVDIIHAAPAHPDWVGLNHPHKVGHFDWRARGKVDLGHVWLGGLLLHERLTGDRRSGEAARAMAQRLAGFASKARNPRQFGWPMIALAAAADASGEARLREAALRYARLGMDRFAPDPASADWKLGIFASGLAAVHRLTADDGVRAWLLHYGERLLADEHARDLDPRYLAVAGYLAALTGDGRYADLARTVAAEMPIGNWGKTLAMHGRVGFELLGFLPAGGRTAAAAHTRPRRSSSGVASRTATTVTVASSTSPARGSLKSAVTVPPSTRTTRNGMPRPSGPRRR